MPAGLAAHTGALARSAWSPHPSCEQQRRAGSTPSHSVEARCGFSKNSITKMVWPTSAEKALFTWAQSTGVIERTQLTSWWRPDRLSTRRRLKASRTSVNIDLASFSIQKGSRIGPIPAGRQVEPDGEFER